MRKTTRNPRRAAAVDPISSTPETDTDVEVVLEDAPRAARRRRVSRLGRGVVGATLAGVLAAGSLFGFAFSQRGASEDFSSEELSVEVAIPEAAAAAAAQGFADRTQDASRNAVRSGLTGAVAGEAAKTREEILESSIEGAQEVMTESARQQRDAEMDADMELVAAQADKLKKEAEEAQRRLEEARKAAVGLDPDHVISNDDLAAATSGGASMPVKSNGFRMGASFGQRGSWSRYHTGQDFPAPVGTPIYAAASGIVLSPTSGGWAGINVVIQHSNGGATLYAHMSKRVVRPGEAVTAGQLIGYVGNTGRSFGAHLHFEYYKPGVTPGDVYSASNPMSFLRSLGVN
ncbi:M23 family metallopeptidase [Tessaracoccus rhinocerotis]|nr:peptidoglycan DD-metalloendopeptidase family protein [Tessaracoccus rhinocerotis]